MSAKGAAHLGCVFLVALTSISLSGCGTVVTSSASMGEIGNGVTYFLPKREVKLTAERRLLVRSDVEKAMKAKQAELEALDALIDTYTETIEIARARMNDPAVNSDAQTLQIVKNTLNIAISDLSKANKDKISAASGVADLYLKLYSIKDGYCNYQYSAKIELQATIPDAEYRFIAKDFHNPLRDDDTKLKVSTDGLLTSANVISTDRTGDIIVEMASSISGFGAGPSPMALTESTKPAPAAVECEKEPVKFVRIFDPTVPKIINEVNGKLGDANILLAIKAEYVKFNFESKKAENNKNKENMKEVLDDSVSSPKNKINRSGGLYYRTPMPVSISVVDRSKSADKCTAPGFDNCTPIDGSIVMLPQAGPISYIPLNSSAFVKTVDDVTFENGMLTSWNSNRPSEVLEIVRLPVKILKSIVSVPGELIKLRIDLSDKEKGLAQAQEAEMAAQAKLRLIQTCVKSAGEDQDMAQACFK